MKFAGRRKQGVPKKNWGAQLKTGYQKKNSFQKKLGYPKIKIGCPKTKKA